MPATGHGRGAGFQHPVDGIGEGPWRHGHRHAAVRPAEPDAGDAELHADYARAQCRDVAGDGPGVLTYDTFDGTSGWLAAPVISVPQVPATIAEGGTLTLTVAITPLGAHDTPAGRVVGSRRVGHVPHRRQQLDHAHLGAAGADRRGRRRHLLGVGARHQRRRHLDRRAGDVRRDQHRACDRVCNGAATTPGRFVLQHHLLGERSRQRYGEQLAGRLGRRHHPDLRCGRDRRQPRLRGAGTLCHLGQRLRRGFGGGLRRRRRPR